MSKGKMQLLELSKIYFEESIYPRGNWWWKTSYSYAKAMQSGAKFPPIVVCYQQGKYYLIDGKHRAEAYKTLKKKSVMVEIIKCKDKGEMLKKAIAYNIANAKPMGVYDRVLAANRLKKLGVSLAEISKAIQVPMDEVKTFVGKRMTNTLSGEPIILKTPVKHLAKDDESPVPEDFDTTQRVFSGDTQIRVIKNFKTLLQNNLLNLKNPSIKKELKEIYGMIKQQILSTRSK